MKQDVPLVRRFSTLEPYQEAYTLACSLETEGQGCWLTVSRTKAPDDPADTARTWVPARKRSADGCCSFCMRIRSSRSCGRMLFPAGIRRRSRQNTCRKGGASCEL
mgnify:CR=1 FL=1